MRTAKQDIEAKETARSIIERDCPNCKNAYEFGVEQVNRVSMAGPTATYHYNVTCHDCGHEFYITTIHEQPQVLTT